MDKGSGQYTRLSEEQNTYWRLAKERRFKESENPFCLHTLCMFYTSLREKILLNRHKLYFPLQNARPLSM